MSDTPFHYLTLDTADTLRTVTSKASSNTDFGPSQEVQT
jgi:hypothetical protein